MLISTNLLNYNQQHLSTNGSGVKNQSITFCAMKKSQFSEVDFYAVEKFKAPIEKFNSNSDLQKWAGEQCKDIIAKDYGGRNNGCCSARRRILAEWDECLNKEDNCYSNTEKLIILNGITKNLKPNDETLPPVLNRVILSDTVGSVRYNLKQNRKCLFDFGKMYKNNLQLYYTNYVNQPNSDMWVIIPSKDRDSANFDDNVKKLRTLSYKTWCSKADNAHIYLEDGDFHILCENGNPKIGMRMEGDTILEIQGELNNGEIPLGYYDKVWGHICDKNLAIGYKAKGEIDTAKQKKVEIKQIKKELGVAIENKDAQKIYDYFGFEPEVNPDGSLTLAKYERPQSNGVKILFSDLGLNENELFKKVTKIKGSLNLSSKELSTLSNLKEIGGDLSVKNSVIEDLGKLERVGGSAIFNTTIRSMNHLKRVEKDFDISGNKNIHNLGELEYIGRDAYLRNTSLVSLANLKEIGGSANFECSKINDMGELERVGGDCYFAFSEIKNLKHLKTIGGSSYFGSSVVEDIGELESIGGTVRLNKPLKALDVDWEKIAGKVSPY